AAERALGRLFDGGLERLAHLGHHEPPERFLLGLQNLRGLEHEPPPLGERGAAVLEVRRRRALESGLELVGRERREGAERFPRGGVDGGDGHGGKVAGGSRSREVYEASSRTRTESP